MTTPPYGANDPLDTGTTDPFTMPPPPGPTSSPIGDELARDRGLDTTPTAPSSTGFDSAGTGDSAKDKAQDVKDKAQDALGTASEQGSQVADTAKDEAMAVAAEAKDKATDLLADVKTQVDEQSKAQLQNLADKLEDLADEIQNLVSGSDSSGTVVDVAQQLADKTHELSSHLQSRQPLDLLDDVRGFARRRPAAFLAGAAVAGVLAGRLTRGAKASQDSGTSPAKATPTSGGASASTGTAPTTTTSMPTTASTTSAPTTGGTPPVTTPSGEFGSVPTGQNTGGRQ